MLPDVGAVFDLVEAAKAWAFPLSALAFVSYPVLILVWNFVEGTPQKGMSRGPSSTDLQGHGKKSRNKGPAPPLTKRVRGFELKGEKGIEVQRRGVPSVGALALLCVGLATLVAGSTTFALAARKSGRRAEACGGPARAASAAVRAARAAPGEEPEAAQELPDCEMAAEAPSLLAPTLLASAAVLLGAAGALRYHLRAVPDERAKSRKKAKSMHRDGSGVLRRCVGSKEVLYTRCEQKAADFQGLRWYAPPADAPQSMWHHVDLHVKNWLDEREAGLFHYVNEIPNGALQKFELQTTLERNVIREDAKGSKKLKAFGRPVPFNYGCFPQTFRDPQEMDEIHGAPGDNDPLDVLDLCAEAVGVGEVVCCRPLGAVCLIDEGQADWKIIAVNTKSKDPLAAARTVAEAEQIAPGRIEQVLRWMDDFKQHSSKNETTLHYEIHDASQAVKVIEKDHASWGRLVKEADTAGLARGHWIRSPKTVEQRPHIATLGWDTPMAVPGQMARHPALLAGASVPETQMMPAYARGAQIMRRQLSTDSGESESVSEAKSSDTERGP